MTAVNEEAILSENRALRLECEAQEAEIANLKSILHVSATRPELYFDQQRVVLNKYLNVLPEKTWQKIVDESPEVDDTAVLVSLGDQLAEKNRQLDSCLQEISDLKARDRNGCLNSVGDKEDMTSHLLSQITFLHNEVERLEEHVVAVRTTLTEEMNVLTIEYKEKLKQKETENRSLIEQLRGRKQQILDEKDLATRNKALENQLANALSEKNSLIMEKNECLSKMRKLEIALRERKNETSEVRQTAHQESTASGIKIKNLQEVIQVLSDERSSLRMELARLHDRANMEKISTDTQTNEISCLVASSQTEHQFVLEKGCQVDSLAYSNDPATNSVQSLAHMLENKCAECDDLRARIDNISSLHEETLSTLEVMRGRLEEEVERQKLMNDDTEKLSLQVRSLQQKCSQYATSERELQARLIHVEEEKQILRASSLSFERERNNMEERLKEFQKDIEMLDANKNYCNQHVDQLASENEKLSLEVQRLHVCEAQLAYSLKAKDDEIREILSAYQNAAKESETQREAYRTLERELDVVRATLASKDQSIIYLQEQLSHLHIRDQQISLDLQAYEYSNHELHRKLVQSQSLVSQLEATCEELRQVSAAKDRAVDELQQSLAEFTKQLALKENECMLLHRRCESLQHDISQMCLTYEAESRRYKDLEDANARLVVRGMFATENDEKLSSLQKEVDATRTALEERERLLAAVQEQLQKEKDTKSRYISDLKVMQASLDEALSSKERLQKIVLDQATTLSHLSQ